ncbi:MAG: hypothetical protein Q7S76_00480 [bacterium]|nr:hypothetical protein [bacterium]
MAIKFTEAKDEQGITKGTVSIDNGDLQALKDVMEQYHFIDEQALMRYALVALLRTSDNQLYVRDNGNIVAMKLAEGLIKKPNPTVEAQ